MESLDISYKKEKRPPLKYKKGDKIMGVDMSMGINMIVGGEIIRVEQATILGEQNQYLVRLLPEVNTGKDNVSWWIEEKDAIEFDDVKWRNALSHWGLFIDHKKKSYLEHIRIFRSFRGEDENLSDLDLQKLIDDEHNNNLRWSRDI